MGRLENKTVIVTGAARGTGAATAEVLVEEGARVVLGDVNAEGVSAVAKRLGPRARSLALDVGDEADWQRAVALAKNELGGVDGLVNNAAVLHLAALEDTRVEDFERLVRVNQIGPFLGIRAVVPAMRERGRGAIVTVASTAGRVGAPYTAAYTASKHAAVGLMRTVAAEVAGTGVTANAVCPTFVRTEMTARTVARIVERTGKSEQDSERSLVGLSPLGRLLEPEEVAFAVAFLAAPEAGAINGQTIVLDGGGIQA
jgi:NAD(P)-dependent dehydrogenase (short-subunit alcohol dehydrogenase family)